MKKMQPSLAIQRQLLPSVGVLLQCLDANKKPLPKAGASGFIRRESDGLFLYTCWHVVSGFNLNDIQVGLEAPLRRYLKIAVQAVEQRAPGMEVIGGLQTLDLPLYEASTEPSRPTWLQDDQHVPNPDLNAIEMFVPFWHDAVKLKLPDNLRVSDAQLVNQRLIFETGSGIAGVGEKCLVVGYPYGFSAFGQQQPTAIVLTRFIASDRLVGRRRELLLERITAPTMSGGPVFIECDENLLLFGLYTGAVYPDYPLGNEKATALGTIADLSFVFAGHLPFVARPSKPVDPV